MADLSFALGTLLGQDVGQQDNPSSGQPPAPAVPDVNAPDAAASSLPVLTIHPSKRVIQGPSPQAPDVGRGAPSTTTYQQPAPQAPTGQQTESVQPAPKSAFDNAMDVFQSALDDKLPPPIVPPTSKRPPIPLSEVPADMAQSLGTGIEQGAIASAGAPADIESGLHGLFTKYVSGPIMNAISGPAAPLPPAVPGSLDDIARNTGSYLGSQGITRGVENVAGPMYKPKSVLGDFAKTVGEFVPTAGRNLVAGALLPGIADEAAGQVTQGTGFEQPARIAGAVLGGALGSAGGGAIQATKDYASAAPDLEAASAARNVGVDLPYLATTNNPVVQGVGSSLKSLPIGGTPIRKASERAVSQIGEARNTAAAMPTGAAVDAETAGETLSKGLERYIGPESKKKVGDLYDAVDAKISAKNPGALTTLDETRKAIGNIMARRVAAGLDGTGKAVDHVLGAVQRVSGLTYDGIKTLRTSVGEMLKGGRLPADMSEGELKQIYGALSQDLKHAVENSGGPEASSAFARANKYASLIADRRQSLDRLLGSRSGESLTAAVQRMAGSNAAADAALLVKARRSVSKDEWNEIASAVIGNLGKNRAGEFSPDIFISDYGKLSAKGKGVLFNSTGLADLPKFLDDIATVSGRFKQLQKFGNSSGTTQTAAGLGELGALGGAISTGTISAPLTVVAGMIGANALSKALARPMSAASIAKWTKSYAAAAAIPSPASLSAAKIATRNMLSTLSGLYDTRNDMPPHRLEAAH